MAIAIERIEGVACGFTDNPDLPSADADASGSYALALWMFRDSESAALTAPTRNGDSFTAIDNVGDVGLGGSLAVYGQIPDVGVYDVLTALSVFKNTAGSWCVFTGVDSTTPLGTKAEQTEVDAGGSWSAPSLTPSSAAGDLIVSILVTLHWDEAFGDTSASTVTLGGSQTLQLDQTADGASPTVAIPRIIISTAPNGSTVSYAFSGAAKPRYRHIAFAVKVSGGGGSPVAKSVFPFFLGN
jgi:hypothetical protein